MFKITRKLPDRAFVHIIYEKLSRIRCCSCPNPPFLPELLLFLSIDCKDHTEEVSHPNVVIKIIFKKYLQTTSNIDYPAKSPGGLGILLFLANLNSIPWPLFDETNPEQIKTFKCAIEILTMRRLATN